MAAGRFAKSTESDLQLIIEDKNAENTKRATQAALKILQMYLIETERQVNLDSYSKEALAQVLRSFYADVRKKDGQKYYKLSALKSIRFGLARHFSKEYDIDIVKDTTFKKANELFSAVLVNLKKEGFGKTDHTAPIPVEELKKLYCSRAFDINTPVGLQQKTWFDLMFFLCRRGRENLRCMNKNTFAIAKDYRGFEYVYQARDELDKNHRENDSHMESPTEGRMYEKPGSDKCPVLSFRKYLSKLNKNCDDLWQRPKDSFYDDSEEWYMKIPVGKNTLSSMMKTISKSAGLSKDYTNHCIRATSITVLDFNKFEARDIMSISGHKSESSLRSYSKTSESKIVEMSEVISSALVNAESSESVNANVVENDNLFDVEGDIYLSEVQINELVNGNNVDLPVSKESQNVTLPSQQTLASQNITSNVLKQIEKISNCPAAYITGCVVNFTVNMNK